MEELHFFADDLERRHGRRIHRIPVDLALGCPNRLNRYGPGCVFCAEDGGRARHLGRSLDLRGQVAAGRKFVSERYGSGGPYAAYFQSFTSTYAPAEQLERLYGEVLRCADFPVVIVATRPDALPPETVDLLREMNRTREVWVELGVQTAHDRTLGLTRRGHVFADVIRAARALRDAGIRAGAHVILGLPGESDGDFAATARELSALPFRAVKLHQLQVLRGTELARWWSDPGRGRPAVRPLNEYEYAAAAASFLRLLPEGWLIMRLCADAPPEKLLAPRWWMKKGQFIEFFRRCFAGGAGPDGFTSVITGDGSETLYHPGYRQHFRSLAGAREETVRKFLEPSRLEERLGRSKIVRVLDVGFGTGANAGAAVRLAERARGGRLEIVSLESDLRAPAAAARMHGPGSWMRDFLGKMLDAGAYESDFATCRLIAGDARAALAELDGEFDAVFQDAFSPDCNPELWTLDWFRGLRRLMADGGTLTTYSGSRPARGALLKLGFGLGESAPFGRRRGGTVARRGGGTPEGAAPLSEKELNIILRSTAGTPYRDPTLRAERAWILAHRAGTVRRLRRMGVPKWFRA